ncbi:MAG TPA: hypothetical protein PKN96_10545 [Flavobacterium sp.]|uniref:hypothetical protein n=1 Tax=Flavobacterium sp. TaxID=239 RepID=UPI002BE51D74|nr:hypothetical protein [Flavobacterium sp.]HNP33719.1 hypothetical protein [Flavobacterium sp.]
MTKLKNLNKHLINCFLPLLSLLLLLGCKESEETKIKKTCETFMQGRRTLGKGDDTALKSITEDKLFMIMKLNQEYVDMMRGHVPISEPDLNIHPVSVTINGNTANCLMSGLEHYEINLYKYKGKWKVKGENGITGTDETIAHVKKQMADYKESQKDLPAKHAVIRFVNSFFDAAKRYFKTQQTDSLKLKCTDDTLDFIKRLYTYAKQRTGMKILTEEIDQPNYLTGDVVIAGDKVMYLFYNEPRTITLKKHNNSYLVSGFNAVDSKYLTQQGIKDDYPKLLRTLKLVRQEQYRNKAIN